MLKEKYAMKERHLQEKNNADKKAARRLKEAEDFIENVNTFSAKERSQEDLRQHLECPVCYREMKPALQIWQCAQGHAVCGGCYSRPEVRKCPTCRQGIVGRATTMEKISATLFTSHQVR